jgi:hypothetical protein
VSPEVFLARRRRAALACAASAAALIAVTAGQAGDQSAAATRAATAKTFNLDHFECYRAAPSDFKARDVRLRDQFGDSEAKVVSRTSLCNPVSKNRGEIQDRRRHLVCYRIKPRGTFERRRVAVRNQFVRGLRLRVLRPTQLCLPSGKTEDDGQGTEIPALDHYQCYAVRPLGQTRVRKVRLRDQFGRVRAKVLRPSQLCNPVRKNGGQIRNKRDHLVCSRIVPARFDPRKVFVTNQFEADSTLEAVSRQRLCLPSRKRLVGRLVGPDLTATILAPPAVSCPGGQGTCTTTVSFQINNVSTLAVGPTDALVRADPGLATSGSVPVGALAAGASSGPLSITLGPANNCFDPNCTLSVTADSGNVVGESNEGNNTDTQTFGG